MHPDLATLKLSDRDIEHLSGLEVNELWVGGLCGGVDRVPKITTLKWCLWFGFTELAVIALVHMFTVPLGLAVIRQASDLNQPRVKVLFLGVTLGITLITMIGWHGYRWHRARLLRPLLHLLHELDRFHQVLTAVDALDRLAAISHSPLGVTDRAAVLDALQLTRDNLVAGLITEKILRSRGGGQVHQADLRSHIEQNLAVLSAMEIQDQAQEYNRLINEALEIGIIVQRTIGLSQDDS